MIKPKIRFKGYQEEWEQRKLGAVAEYRNGKAHENEIDDDGEYIVVNSKFVSTNGEIRKFSSAQNEPLYENEIAFVLSDVPNGRAIARTFLIDRSGKYTLNQRIAGITPHEDTDPYYLYIKMNRNAYFLKFDDGNKQTNLSIKDVLNYSSTKIDYEYIINLIQNIVAPNEGAEAVSPEERQKQIEEVKQYIEEMQKDNPKVADIMAGLVSEIEADENKYRGQSIRNIVENIKQNCIDKVISDFCVTWYASKEDVMYAALHYRNGEIPNESVIKATIDYQGYKSAQEKVLPKFKYYAKCMSELKKILDKEIKPLIRLA